MSKVENSLGLINLIVAYIIILLISGYFYQYNNAKKLERKLYSQGNELNFYKNKYQFNLINEAIIYQKSNDFCEAYDKLYLADSLIKLTGTSVLFLNEMKEKCNEKEVSHE